MDRKRSQSIGSLVIFALLSLIYMPLWATEGSSYVQLGLSEEKRHFSLGELADDVYVHGRSLYIQRGSDSISLAAGLTENKGSEQYDESDIGFESRSYSVYLDAAFEALWLGGSVQWQEEDVGFETDEEKLKTDREAESVSLGLDLGYRYEALWGLVSVVGSLSWQDVEENQKLTFTFENGVRQIQDVDIEDENLSATMMAEYSYFMFLGQGIDASVSMALSRSLAIEGGAVVEREITRAGRLIASDKDQLDNNTAQTNQRLRTSLYVGDFDMSIELERIDEQSFSSAYKGIGLGVGF